MLGRIYLLSNYPVHQQPRLVTISYCQHFYLGEPVELPFGAVDAFLQPCPMVLRRVMRKRGDIDTAQQVGERFGEDVLCGRAL